LNNRGRGLAVDTRAENYGGILCDDVIPDGWGSVPAVDGAAVCDRVSVLDRESFHDRILSLSAVEIKSPAGNPAINDAERGAAAGFHRDGFSVKIQVSVPLPQVESLGDQHRISL